MTGSEGDRLARVLTEQAAYYHALGGDYLDQDLDLPGGDELGRGPVGASGLGGPGVG